MRLINEVSAGDKKFYKFIIILTDKNPEITKTKYDKDLGGYYVIWDYVFNNLTYQHDKNTTHWVIFQSLPAILKRISNSQNTFIGLTTEVSYGEELFVAGFGETPSDAESVKKFLSSIFDLNRFEYSYERMDPYKISLLD